MHRLTHVHKLHTLMMNLEVYGRWHKKKDVPLGRDPFMCKKFASKDWELGVFFLKKNNETGEVIAFKITVPFMKAFKSCRTLLPI